MRHTLLIPALWIVSFLLSLYFVPSLNTLSMGLSIIVLFAWAFYAMARKAKEWQIPSSFVFYVLMVFWGLAFISVVLSDIFYVSFMAFCFFSVLPFSVLAFAQINNFNFFKSIGKEVVILLTLLGAWAVIQIVFFPEVFGVRAVNPLRNPNSLAALLNFGVVGGFGLLLYAQDRQHKMLSSVFFTVCFIGVLVTGSRGALFAVLPLLFIFGGVCWRAAYGRALYLAGSIIILVAVFLYYQSHFLNDAMLVRIAALPSEGMNSFLSNREQLWMATWEMIKQHGILGTGIGTYFLYFPEFRLPTDFRGAYYAHNDPLQFWVEMGVVAPILFYAIAIGIAVKTVQAFKLCKNEADKFALLIPFFALGVMVTHAHVTFNFSNLSILLLSGFALGAWFNAVKRIQPYKMISFKAGKTYKVKIALLAGILIVMASVIASFILSEVATNKAKAALFTGDFPVYAHHVLQAKKLSGDMNHRANLLAATMPITLLKQKQFKDAAMQRDIYTQTMSYLEQAIASNPRSASPYFYKGYIQQLVPRDFIDDDVLPPEDYYQRALQLDPLHLGARMALADYYAQAADLVAEQEVLEAGVEYIYSTENALVFYDRLRGLYQKAGSTAQVDGIVTKMTRLKSRLDKARAQASDAE